MDQSSSTNIYIRECEDEKLKEELKNSLKERTENIMIVDLVRNDLARSAESGSVNVDELFGIYSFNQVHQMISTVSSRLSEKIHFIDAIKMAYCEIAPAKLSSQVRPEKN